MREVTKNNASPFASFTQPMKANFFLRFVPKVTDSTAATIDDDAVVTHISPDFPHLVKNRTPPPPLLLSGRVSEVHEVVTLPVQGLAKRRARGCVNAACKVRQKWQATAATKFTKPGRSLLAKSCT